MFVGIDTSKDFFDAAALDGDKVLFQGRYENNMAGFEAFSKALRGCKLVAIEATGPYHLPLAIFLYKKEIPVSVVNPLVIKRFSQMKMARAKTDKKDSLLIAQYGQQERPGPWEAPSGTITGIQQLDTYLEGLGKRKLMASNQLHAFDSTGQLDGRLRGELEDEVAMYEAKIKKAEREIDELIMKGHKNIAERLRSIPGIGPKSAYLMIASTNGFKNFDNHKQVISYFGLAPRVYESGSSVRGKGRICKMGMSRTRKTLYMAARSAIRFNKACRALYERLRAKGKSHRQAMVAAVNKLIKQAFAIVKSGKMYDPEFGAAA